jgi:hypothetical protein
MQRDAPYACGVIPAGLASEPQGQAAPHPFDASSTRPDKGPLGPRLPSRSSRSLDLMSVRHIAASPPSWPASARQGTASPLSQRATSYTGPRHHLSPGCVLPRHGTVSAASGDGRARHHPPLHGAAGRACAHVLSRHASPSANRTSLDTDGFGRLLSEGDPRQVGAWGPTHCKAPLPPPDTDPFRRRLSEGDARGPGPWGPTHHRASDHSPPQMSPDARTFHLTLLQSKARGYPSRHHAYNPASPRASADAGDSPHSVMLTL